MNKEIINSYTRCLDELRRMVSDLSKDQMVAQPDNLPNHPAWTIGHLIYSAQAIGGEMGLQPWMKPDWEISFKSGSKPVSDAAKYPKLGELIDALDDAQNRLVRRLSAMTDADLAEPLPDERYRHIFPSVGHAVLHILTVHAAYHVGQVAAWRLAMGLSLVSDL
jgi:hypothetical protein